MSFTQTNQGIWLIDGTPASINGQKLQANMEFLSSVIGRTRYNSSIATGTGTEASPYTHADGTGGINTLITSLIADRGGCIALDGKTSISTPILMTNTKGGISLRGTSAGFMQDIVYGADAEGLDRGTKIKVTANVNCINIGNATTPRPTAMMIDRLYLDGNSAAVAGPHGIHFAGHTDHVIIQDVNIRNFYRGIYDPVGYGDSIVIDRVQMTACRIPVEITSTSYGRMVNTIFSHNYAGCNFSGGVGVVMTGCALVYNCLEAGTSYNMVFGGTGCTMAGNSIVTAGWYDDTKDFAHALQVTGTGTSCTGNFLGAGATTFEIICAGSKCNISGNTLLVPNTGTPKIVGNISVGGNNNIIDQPTWSVSVSGNDNVINAIVTSDTGSRNIINGISKNAGDPASAGVWNGVAKPDGVKIYDTSNNKLYLYHSLLSGGRKEITLV